MTKQQAREKARSRFERYLSGEWEPHGTVTPVEFVDIVNSNIEGGNYVAR